MDENRFSTLLRQRLAANATGQLRDYIADESPRWRTYLLDNGSIESRRILNEDLSRCLESMR